MFSTLVLYTALATDVTAAVPALETVTAPAAVTDSAEMAEIERALAADAPPETPQPAPAAPAASYSGAMPDISFVLDVAGAYFSDSEPLQAGAHDPARTGFNLQQLEMSLRSTVDPYFRFNGSLVFALDEVEIEEAYGTTLSLPYSLQARFGQYLTRFGRINSQHPHAWSFADQPIVMSKVFGGEANRGLGAELSYLTPLPWYVELIGSTNDAGEGPSFLNEEERTIHNFSDLQHMGAVKQFFALSDDTSLSWGISGMWGPNSTGLRTMTEIYGTDVYLKWRPLSADSDAMSLALQAELLLRRREVPADLLSDHGGYAQVVWRLDRRWETGVRGEFVTGLKSDPVDPDWTEERERYAGQFTFYPTEFSRMRLQVNRDAPRWRNGYWGGFLAVELVVGAHGAHAF